MAIGTDAHQHQIEQRSRWVEVSAAIESLQDFGAAAGGFIGTGSVCWDWMHMVRGRQPIEEDFARHVHIVQGMIACDEALVADEPVHAIPGNPFRPGGGREQLIELLRTRSTGQANRDAAFVRRDPCDQPSGRSERQLCRIGGGDFLKILRHPVYPSVRQLRPSRLSNSSAPAGPSPPALYISRPLASAFFQASRNGCTACQPASTLSAR